MPHLAISLLGAFEATLDGSPVTGFKSEKTRALLAYLAVERDHAHRRQSLVGLLWPGYPEKYARANLRVALNNLRQLLKDGEHQIPYILVEGETIRFNPESDFCLDIKTLEKAASDSQSRVVFEELPAALAQYKGCFLEGFSLKDSPEFDDWTYILRERYQQMASTILGRLAEGYEQKQDFEKALAYARQRLELEPWQEEAHRLLMRLLALQGQRSQALAQYEVCRRNLNEALGVEPATETLQLYISIRDGEFSTSKPDKLRQHNLPAQVNSFVGREKEIEEIKALFQRASPPRRLVTLTGAGGSGKTRLALQVGWGALELFLDGVWLVELAPLVDAELVVQAVGRALGMRLEASAQAQIMLEEYLEAKDLLLILDNCEHLIEACSRLAEALLHACPNLHILATSREALGIEGEVSYLVPPLTFPAAGDLLSMEKLEQYEAIRLFVERAENVSPGFVLTQENAVAVAQICRRLDGIPLALELAARRVKMLKVEEIVGHLGDRFRLLTGGSRAALPRYQTLQASVDWSYELLSVSERGLLQRLSVFAGSWTLEAAEFTGCGKEIESTDMLDLLGSLVNKSMVEIVTSTGSTTRYRMLETIRQYAHEKLVEAGQFAAARDRILAYYVELAEKLEDQIRGPDQGVIMDQLEAELDNLRQVMEWSLETGNPEMGLRLAAALQWFWHARGWQYEGLNWLERLLSCQTQQRIIHPLSHAQRLVRAKALQSAAILDVVGITRGSIFSEEGASLCQELGPAAKKIYAYLLRELGSRSLGMGDRPRTTALAEESQALFLEVGDRFGYCESTDLLAMEAILEKKYEKAQLLIEESLAIRKEIGDQDGISWELILFGCVALSRHEYERARLYLDESLLISSQINCVQNFDVALLHIGLINWLQGKYAQASLDFEKLLSESRRQGVLYYIQIGFSALGRLALSKGDFERATWLMKESLAFARNKKPNIFMMNSLLDLGILAFAKGEIEQAAQIFVHILELNQAAGEKTLEVNALYGLGRVACERGDFSSASKHFFEVIAKRWGVEWPFIDWTSWSAALPLEALALLAVAQQQMEAAARLLGATEDYQRKYQYTRSPRERDERSNAIAIVREALGEVAFKQAWNAGLAMTLEQAIEFARQQRRINGILGLHRCYNLPMPIAAHNPPDLAFQHLLTVTSQSITARGLALYASAPDHYARLSALPFPAYILALSEDLKTPEFSALLSSASRLFGLSAQNLANPELEALRQRFFDCTWQAAAAQTWFPQEGGHAQRVARNAAGLAARLGYSGNEIHEIYWGGLLHDIGKVFVGELFVALSDQGIPIETTMPFIRTHASLGRDFLESVQPLFSIALVCAAQHQESVDGSGYPDGLKYDQLTLPGQIANLADGYDATVTRLGWSASQICADIQGMYARAGHPHAPIVTAFIQLVGERHADWYPPFRSR